MIINSKNYISNKNLEKIIINFLLYPKSKLLNKDLKLLIIEYIYQFNEFVLKEINFKKTSEITFLYHLNYENIIGDDADNFLILNLNNIDCYMSYPNIYSFDPIVHLSLYINNNTISLIKYIENDIEEKIKIILKRKKFHNFENNKFYSSIINNKLSINMNYKDLAKIKDDTVESVNLLNYEIVDVNKGNWYVSIRDLNRPTDQCVLTL